MPTALSRRLSSSDNLEHVAPMGSVCIVDGKPQIRKVLHEILNEFGLTACECADASRLRSTIRANVPEVVLVGPSNNADEAIAMLESMAAIHFKGKVALVGSSDNLQVKNAQQMGAEVGVAMLPILRTPIDDRSLLKRVADLLPDRELEISVDVVEALDAGWVELWYQPKFNVQTQNIAGLEALARVRHPVWGILSPATFLPAKDDPYFRVFSDFVISQAVEDWNNYFKEFNGLEIAINLSPEYFDEPQAFALLAHSLPHSPTFAGLCIEMDAFDVVRNTTKAKSIARQLKKCGIATSIDDVTLEWPILMRQSDFPFAEIKVDRKLIAGCAHHHEQRSMCEKIISFAHKFNVRTVAEGVEREAEFLAIRELGFDLVQGYLFGRPMSAPDCLMTMSRN